MNILVKYHSYSSYYCEIDFEVNIKYFKHSIFLNFAIKYEIMQM